MAGPPVPAPPSPTDPQPRESWCCSVEILVLWKHLTQVETMSATPRACLGQYPTWWIDIVSRIAVVKAVWYRK